ncbi:MAG: UDP-3-O-(3-hydroxymyristoyl)glucosamine N-acyltransferase [Alphaproteobacteria bacterium]|nr:UDP-3-O-(3-hydroxymyristoyl)glucosamine N-acyltransferase [Alphaproteobacteria bacterium]
MADPRFFRNAGPHRLGDIARLTSAELSNGADANASFSSVAPLDTATREDISFLDNPKYIETFVQSHAGACFVHPKHMAKAPQTMALLVSENPYLCFAQTATLFFPAPVSCAEISSSASIDTTATIGEGCEIGAGAYIGKHVLLGKNCVIAPNAVIANGVTIGDHTRVGANTSITHAVIGAHVIIHSGVNIGQDGFGFAKSPTGAIKVPQLGRVIVENYVEIGAGSCIDRGAGPDTIIGAGSKIDNLVQIGHNVKMGRSAILVSQVGVSGSTEIGDGATLAGQVGVAGHIRIGHGATVAAKAGVSNNIPDGAIYGGFPAIPIMDWRRQVAAVSRLIKKRA